MNLGDPNVQVFERLKGILQGCRSSLRVTADGPTEYSLYSVPSADHPKGQFFGAVQIRKRYVAFHLMPVYMHPELLDDVTPTLRSRMQGKSCFNFKTLDEEAFGELARLTEASFDRFRRGLE